MPRTRNISWERRDRIFLAFRRAGKIYPVARQFNLARSTVDGIVREYREEGFAAQPRAQLSTETLAKAQEYHLREVLADRGRFEHLPLTVPHDRIRGRLGPEMALSDGYNDPAALPDPIRLTPRLAWHVKGTEAARLIAELRSAVRTYDWDCLSLWRACRDILVEPASPSAPPWPITATPEAGPVSGPCHFHTAFVDLLYRMLLGGLPPPDEVEPAGGRLMVGGVVMALGDPQDHPRFEAKGRHAVQRCTQSLGSRAHELEGLYGDLRHVEAILRDALDNLELADLQQRICPECPYPEGREDATVPKPQPRRQE